MQCQYQLVKPGNCCVGLSKLVHDCECIVPRWASVTASGRALECVTELPPSDGEVLRPDRAEGGSMPRFNMLPEVVRGGVRKQGFEMAAESQEIGIPLPETDGQGRCNCSGDT